MFYSFILISFKCRFICLAQDMPCFFYKDLCLYSHKHSTTNILLFIPFFSIAFLKHLLEDY